MTTFKLNYKNGSHEVVQTDALTVEDQVNRTFGLSVKEAKDFGVGAEILPDDPEDLLQAMTKDVLKHPDDVTIVPETGAAPEDLEINVNVGAKKGKDVTVGMTGVTAATKAGTLNT